MQRIISYRGHDIKDDSLVVGNQGDVHLQVDGDFRISGLIYCPKHALKITIKGKGTLVLHGVCKVLEIKSVQGECLLDLIELKVHALRCHGLKGKCIVKIGDVRSVAERNVGDGILLIGCHKISTALVNAQAPLPDSTLRDEKILI